LIGDYPNVVYVYSMAEIAGQLSDTISRESFMAVIVRNPNATAPRKIAGGYLSARG
jgi:hypothetical protein